MKRHAAILVVAIAWSAIAIAQPGDPTIPPAGSGSAPAPGSGSAAPAPGSGSAAGSGSATTGSGSGSAKGPRIIHIPTDASAPQVTAAAAPTTIKLGTKFTLFVRATFNPGVVVNLQEPIDLGPAFEVTRKLSEDSTEADGRTTREWQIEVIAWEIGDLIVPQLPVTYTVDGKASQTGTNAAKVTVVAMVADADDPKAMRANSDPHELLVRDWFWMYVGIAGAVGLAALIFTVMYIRARRHRVVLVGGVFSSRPRKFDTPASRALEKLLAIESSGILDRDDDRKQGYADMADVVREYLGTRYRVATLDLTTSELMRQLDKVEPAVAKDERTMIERWLESCDIVKYGGLKVAAADGKRTLDGARETVLSTSQAEQKPKAELPKPPPIVDESRDEVPAAARPSPPSDRPGVGA